MIIRPEDIDDDISRDSFKEYCRVLQQESDSKECATKIAKKTILKRLALYALYCRFEEIKTAAAEEDNTTSFEEDLNIAAWKMLYDSNAILSALRQPD